MRRKRISSVRTALPQMVLRLSRGGKHRDLALDPALVRRIRRVVVGAVLFQVLSLVLIGVLWQRGQGLSRLVDENLALRTQLAQMDQRVKTHESMLERLRFYDAELRSLTEARGPAGGPLPVQVMANAGLEDLGDGVDEPPDSDPGLWREGFDFDASQGERERPAAQWAADVSHRLEDLLHTMGAHEADLSALMADLETLDAVRAALPGRWPVDGVITSAFGWRRDPWRRTWRFHSGLDIATARGTAIRAAAPGTVIVSTYGGGYGNYVELDHGFGVHTRYGHMSRRAVNVGDVVQSGDYIGAVGSTGRSTGPHLHFEVRIDGNAQDPMTYLPR